MFTWNLNFFLTYLICDQRFYKIVILKSRYILSYMVRYYSWKVWEGLLENVLLAGICSVNQQVVWGRTKQFSSRGIGIYTVHGRKKLNIFKEFRAEPECRVSVDRRFCPESCSQVATQMLNLNYKCLVDNSGFYLFTLTLSTIPNILSALWCMTWYLFTL